MNPSNNFEPIYFFLYTEYAYVYNNTATFDYLKASNYCNNTFGSTLADIHSENDMNILRNLSRV